MRKKWHITLLLTLMLLLCACSSVQSDDTIPSVIPSHQPESTDAPGPSLPEPEPTDGAVYETESPMPPHSELYLPKCSAEQMTAYFEEVVLHVEYTDGTGADNLVQKWLTPLYYRMYGTPTETDLEVLNALFEQLNAVPGFPGIYPAADELQENVSISFLEPEAFRESFSAVINGEEAYGAVQFWYYTLTNELHTARIGYRTDVEQSIRNSVLVEEIINMLGISDTVLRPDSITYQYSDENTGLSDVDQVILRLLYDPSIQCGMTADSCAAIIQELYY